MADLIFNVSLGRVAEFYVRVDTSDPTDAVFEIFVLATAGIEADAVLRDTDNMSALFVGSTDEVTNGGYASIVLDDTDLVAFAPDDTNDRVDLDIPDQTFSAIAAGDGWNDIVIGYDSDSTVGGDANIIPMTLHDFVVVPDGSDITMQVAAAGFYRASE